MVTCIIRTEICHVAPRYRPGRTILPTTIDRFSNSLPDLSKLLSEPKQTDELEEMTSSLSTIFTSTLDIVAPIRLEKVRDKTKAPWYNRGTHAIKRETCNLERKWKQTNLEVFRIAWKDSKSPKNSQG